MLALVGLGRTRVTKWQPNSRGADAGSRNFPLANNRETRSSGELQGSFFGAKDGYGGYYRSRTCARGICRADSGRGEDLRRVPFSPLVLLGELLLKCGKARAEMRQSLVATKL